ncbi:MAG TPA: hypothetical protein VK762_05835 [Polyangiaceae bacterium]|jgi:hypothetical protein|nr:hypothetical protein [Polyangiaceae bacterium]
MESNLGALKRLARDFRYRPLPSLEGSKLPVASFDAVEGGLRALLEENGLRPTIFDGNNFRASIAKYDLIDVRFGTSPAALEHADTRTGLAALRELGFLESPQDGEDGGSCLEMLAEDINDGICQIKLFLQAETPRNVRDPVVRRQMIKLKLPKDYFPRNFILGDACVTNANGIWLEKHLWL